MTPPDLGFQTCLFKGAGCLISSPNSTSSVDQDSSRNTMATKVGFLCLGFLGLPLAPSLQNLFSIIGQTKTVPRCPRLRCSEHLSSLARVPAHLRFREIFHPIPSVRIQSKEVRVVKGALI